ncbi:MAG: hypothetical protein ACRC42_03800 [Mycoplasma sp.]
MRLVKKKSNLKFLFSNIMIIGTLVSIIIPLTSLKEFGVLTSYQDFEINMQFGVISLMSFASYSATSLLNSFVIKTEKLAEDVLYKDGFILQKFSNEQIWQYIKNKNIKNACVIKVIVQGLESSVTKLGSSYATKIKTEIIGQLRNELSELDPLFYMQSEDTEYFAIIPLSDISTFDIKKTTKGNFQKIRDKNDILKFIEEKINSVTEAYNNTANNDFKVKIFCYLSIYGILNNDIMSINNKLSSLKSNYAHNIQNSIYFYNSNNPSNQEHTNQIKALEDLGEFGPNEIQVTIKEFNCPQVRKNLDYKLHISNVSLFKKFIFDKEELYNLSDVRSTKAAIMCHISAKSIHEFIELGLNIGHNRLIIQYPQYLLEQSSFNLTQLISNLSSYQVSQNDVILEIQIDSLHTTQLIEFNVLELIKNNFVVTFSTKVQWDNQKLVKYRTIY